MKPKGCGPRNLGSPFKQTKGQMTKDIKKVSKREKSFGDSAAEYIQGKQGYIPDFITGGKPTRQAMNESTMLNPRSSSENMADMADSRTRAGLVKEKNKGGKMSKGGQNMLNYYNNKAEQTRPNRKDRY
jgi:hypothetical protein